VPAPKQPPGAAFSPIPTLLYEGELFWGDDQMQSLADVLDGRDPIDTAALERLAASAPPGVTRPR
jgi:hypothetical protein